MLAGVCGGLAEYTRTDPLLWRLGFVAVGLAGPGIIVYALLWILMPEAGSAAGDGSRPLDGLMDRLRYGNAGAPPPPPGGTGSQAA
jgi:phage shock protein PspC (stress-responsive transcriptional regulator)